MLKRRFRAHKLATWAPLCLALSAGCSAAPSPSGSGISATTTAPAPIPVSSSSCTGLSPCGPAPPDPAECRHLLLGANGCPGSLGFAELLGDTHYSMAIFAGSGPTGEAIVVGVPAWGGGAGDAAAQDNASSTGALPSAPAIAAKAGSFVWMRRDAAGKLEQTAAFGARSVVDASLLPDGNMVVVGTLDAAHKLVGTQQIPSGTSGFLAALQPSGDVSWSRVVADVDAAEPRRVAVGSAGHLVVTGNVRRTTSVLGTRLSRTPGDAFAAVVSSTGKTIWVDRLTDVNSWSVRAVIDASGTTWTLAQAGHPYTYMGDGPWLHVAKRDAAGTVLFAKSFAPGVSVHGANIALGPAKHVYLVANIHGNTDFGKGPVGHPWSASVIAAKLDATGQLVWSTTVFVGASTSDLQVATDGEQCLWIAGVWQDSPEPLPHADAKSLFVARLDTNGHILFVRLIDAWGQKELAGIGTRASGSLVGLLRFDGRVTVAGKDLVSHGASNLLLFEIKP